MASSPSGAVQAGCWTVLQSCQQVIQKVNGTGEKAMSALSPRKSLSKRPAQIGAFKPVRRIPLNLKILEVVGCFIRSWGILRVCFVLF